MFSGAWSDINATCTQQNAAVVSIHSSDVNAAVTGRVVFVLTSSAGKNGSVFQISYARLIVLIGCGCHFMRPMEDGSGLTTLRSTTPTGATGATFGRPIALINRRIASLAWRWALFAIADCGNVLMIFMQILSIFAACYLATRLFVAVIS